MIFLFNAAFPTLGVMCYEIFYKKSKRNPLFYVGLFFLLCVFHYAFDSVSDNHVHANERKIECSLTRQQREYYWKLIHDHYYQSWKCAYEAESLCTFIPDKISKAAAKSATAAIATGVTMRNMQSAAIAAIITGLQEILEQFGWIWNDMNSNLVCAKYHVEMAEFYQDVLAGDGG